MTNNTNSMDLTQLEEAYTASCNAFMANAEIANSMTISDMSTNVLILTIALLPLTTTAYICLRKFIKRTQEQTKMS